MLGKIGQPKDIHYHDAIKHGRKWEAERGENEKTTNASEPFYEFRIGKQFRRCSGIYTRIRKENTQHAW